MYSFLAPLLILLNIDGFNSSKLLISFLDNNFIICHPNLVSIGPEISPILFKENAAFSKGIEFI